MTREELGKILEREKSKGKELAKYGNMMLNIDIRVRPNLTCRDI